MAKVARVDVYLCSTMDKPTRQFGSFIEGAHHLANNSTQKMVVVLDDGTEIAFDGTQFVGPTEVTIKRN